MHMKIAIFSDTHLGYPRFEEDSYLQATEAIIQSSQIADVILCAGDIFDTKIPKLETLNRAIEIFNLATKPLFLIFGNHERRSKELINPVQLLANATKVTLLHGNSSIFEKNSEKIQIFGLGSVPEEYAEAALKKTLEKFKPDADAFRILMIHQSIKELMANSKDELSLEFLESLPFSLIINGHIHKTTKDLGGKFLIPGSTVITQLKKDETDPKGFFIFDTFTKIAEFIPIKSRTFFYEELDFVSATQEILLSSIRKLVSERKKDHPNSIISIKLRGTLFEGLKNSDMTLPIEKDVYIDNCLDQKNLISTIDKIRELRAKNISNSELILSALNLKLDGKISLFSPTDLLEQLSLGTEEALNYLNKFQQK